jgi:hypothetical protein
LKPLPAGEEVVTSSDETEFGSSEFSNCVVAQAEEGEEEEGEEEEGGGGGGGDEEGEGEAGGEEAEEEEGESGGGARASGAGPAPPGSPAPENGETVVAAPQAGTIYLRRPGQKKRRPLKEGEAIPVGSIVDATHGKVTLTSVNAAGEAQTATFYGGVFLVLQHGGSGLVILRLQDDTLKSCRPHPDRASRRASSSSRRHKRKHKGNHLWGSGKGNFRTEGNYGSATVRGTVWFSEDRCDGTFFKVRRGVVTVRDFPHHRTVSLPKGKSYLATP